MYRTVFIGSTLLAVLLLSGCGSKQHQVKAEAIEAGVIDVDNVSYFCVDGVRYIKYEDDEQFGVTVKFNKDGSVDTGCEEVNTAQKPSETPEEAQEEGLLP